MRRKERKFLIRCFLFLVLLLLCLGCYWYLNSDSAEPQVTIPTTPVPTVKPTVMPTVMPTVVPTQAPASGDPLIIHFIDVGQADAILLSHDGKYAMVDAGKSMADAEVSESALERHLDRFDGLDWLLATHQDSDHIGLARYVMTSDKTKTFYDNGNPSDTFTYTKLMTFLTDNNIDYTILSAGDTINTWDDVGITVMSSAITNGYDVNDDSIVLLVEYGGTKVALTGDISKDVEGEIGARLGDVDILKVPHHGSKTSASSTFLQYVKPEVSVISVGENSYGHPNADTADRLDDYGTIYRTDEYGCVEVVITDSGYYVRHCEWA